MEMKMLHWTSGATRFGHCRKEDIRDHYGVAPIGLIIEVDGKRPKGQPKQRWLDTLEPRDCTQIRDSIELNGETDYDEPTSFVNGTKAEEKEEDP